MADFKAHRQTVSLPDLIRESIANRSAALRYGSFSQYVVALILSDFHAGGDHAGTFGEVARIPPEAQDVLLEQLVRHIGERDKLALPGFRLVSLKEAA